MARYWVGGTGNWDASTTTHWSDSSGGAGGQSVPTSTDDVIFDGGSASDNYTVTITATANCANFTMDKPTGVGKKVTWAGSSALNIYGSLTLTGGTTGITRSYTGDITFAATSSKTITCNSVSLGSSLIFNGVSGTWIIQDALNISTSKNITLTNGTLNTNNQTITCYNFGGGYSKNTRVLTLGSSTINVYGAYDLSSDGTHTTINPDTSSIVLTNICYFTGDSKTYNNITFNTSAANSGSATITSTTATNITFNEYSGATVGNITVYGNITITGTLTIAGYSSTVRFLVKSNTLGTARTITTTGGSVVITNCDFQDITATGDAGDWDLSAITGGSGDCGGNTGITFTTADDWYWHADTGNVSDYTKWYTATNGGGSQMASTLVPLPQDTLHFDASSFDSGSQTVTQNMPRIGSIDWTGATNTPTFTTSTAASVFGSITLISGMTLTASTEAYTFGGRNTYTLDCGGKTWKKDITINAPTGTLTLKSDISTDEFRTLTISSGTFSAVDGVNNYSVNVGRISVSGGILTLGTGTHSLSGYNSNVFNYSSGTITTFTGTIKFVGVLLNNIKFIGGGKIYGNFWNATTGAYYLTVEGSNTFNDFKIDAGRTVKFTNSTNTTVTTFTALGTSGSHITLSNTSSTTHATLTKAGGGVIDGCDYVDSSYLTGSPDLTWYMGANSTNTDCTNMYTVPTTTTTKKIPTLLTMGVG